MTEKTHYTPGLFTAIAEEVSADRKEQYLFARKGRGRPTLMFTSSKVENALALASEQVADPVQLIAVEYQCATTAGSQVFRDGARGMIEVGGVLVEVEVREIATDEWRVLFSRVDALTMYGGLEARVRALEQSMSKLQEQAVVS